MPKKIEKIKDTEQMYAEARELGIFLTNADEKYSVILGFYGKKLNELVDGYNLLIEERKK